VADVFGVLGLLLLVASYALSITKYAKYFWLGMSLTSLLLVLHSLMIKDVVFFGVNLFACVIALYNFKNGSN